MLLSPLPLLLLLTHLPSLTLASEDAVAVADSPELLASTTLVEVHETILTFLQPKLESNDDDNEVHVQEDDGFGHSKRHEEEKQRLMVRMSKSTGNYNQHHTRHRLLDAMHGFLRYYERQNEEVERLQGLYKSVSKYQNQVRASPQSPFPHVTNAPPPKKILENHVSYSSRFADIQAHLRKNQALCDQIVESGLAFYGIPRSELDEHIKSVESGGGRGEKTSVSQGLKHIVRDWTTSGARERANTFSCLLATLENLFLNRTEENPTKILLPGAGVGRLGHDVADLGGFEVTTNEWSMYMNIIYRHLTSSPSVAGPNSTVFHPFLDSYSHHLRRSSQTRQLTFPSTRVRPSAVLLTEGDFTSVFHREASRYDVVLTYFFIDTARNLMSYFETIRSVLKPGGYWINLGPLLYGTAPFVQLSLEEVVQVSEALGFEFLETEGELCGVPTFDGTAKVRGMDAVYSFDEMQLTRSAYLAQFWVARLSK